MTMRALPKVELHLHLDCSLSYQAVSRLAPSVTRAEYDRDYVAPSRCENLADYLARAPKGYRLMQDEAALQLVIEDMFAQLAADNVIYAEIRFAPLLHTEGGMKASRVVEVLDRATEQCSRATGIEARLILCTLRHFHETQSMATVKLVHEFQGGRVVALDLAGDEAGYPLQSHIPAYRYAHEHDLHCTAHAGEACGPKSVTETLEQIQPARIGHGVRSIEDPSVVDRLLCRGAHLEICPSSNVQIIPSIPTLQDHPVNQLYRAGVSLSINTDTRMLTPTTLSREYELLQQQFGWTEQDFLATNEMAIQAAFTDQETKARIRSRLQADPPTAH